MTRHFAIGDIHGCHVALETLLKFVGLREDDEVITLGDYCDRGPDSKGVLEWLVEFSATGRLHPLRGNHEVMMLEALIGNGELENWTAVGGDATLRSYRDKSQEGGDIKDVEIPEAHLNFLHWELLPSYETESHFFVHANAYPEISICEQPDFMLYWEKYDDPPLHESGKIMVCGHSSQKNGLPITNGNAICIDTWAYGKGWLTCLGVESGMIWQANEQGETRKFWLDEL
jgi:serine/threonine protein phosphatase 1